MNEEINQLRQHCDSLSDLYLDMSTGVGECRPCTKKCFRLPDDSLLKSCRDLQAQGYCLNWPRPQVEMSLNHYTSPPLNMSNISSWGIALAILGVMLFILGIVFSILYLNKDNPRLKRSRTRFRKRFRLLLQHIGIVSHYSYPTEEEANRRRIGDAAVAISLQEQMEPLEPTNESGAYSILIHFIIIMLAILTLTYCYKRRLCRCSNSCNRFNASTEGSWQHRR